MKNEKAPTIEQVKAAGACKPGIEWYAKNEQDTAKLAKHRPDWYLWMVESLPGEWIVEEEFNYAVEEYPLIALYYKHVCDRMNNEQFDRAVKERPLDALYYKHACDRLSDKQFDHAVKECPWRALEHKHARDRMTDEQKAYCEKNA